MTGEMSPDQIDIARHSLGLTQQKASFRNYYNLGEGGDGYEALIDMVSKGWARKHTNDYWTITEEGIQQVLLPGESA
jgi:hypothetical protein